jgi:hypothetical protein
MHRPRGIVLTPRCRDDPRNPDDSGICDVGAYEFDHLFGNGYDWATDDARERVESWVGRNGVHRSLRHCSRPLPATRHLT